MASHSVRSIDVADGTNAAEVTRNCSTIAELHNVLPLSFRPTLGAYLTKIYRTASKASTVTNTTAQYERHLTANTFPPFISNALKVPKIQFSNEYDATAEGRTTEETLKAVIHTARKSYLEAALKRKKQEQTTLLSLLVFDKNKWQTEVYETASRVAAAFGATVSVNPETRVMSWSGSSIPSEIRTEATGLFTEGNVYHVRAISIARAIADKSLLQRVKTLTLKEETKSDAMDVDSKDSSVQNAIEEALKKFEQKFTSGAITVKTKTTNQPKGGRGGRQAPRGGRNMGKVNKPQPKKVQKKKGKRT